MSKTRPQPKRKGISLKTFKTRVAAEELADVYLFAGKEALLHEEALQVLRERLFPDSSAAEFDVDLVYGNDVSAEDLATRVATAPLLAEFRFVVVRRAEQLKDAPEVLGKGSPGRGASVLVLDYSPGKSAPAGLPGTLVDLTPPKDYELPGWLRERGEHKGLHLSPDAAECLIKLVGSSTERTDETTVLSDLDNELDKLLLFAQEGQPIRREDVEAVVGGRPDQSQYAFSEAVLHCRIPAASTIAESLALTRRYLDAALPQVGLDLLRLMKLKAALDEGVSPRGLAKAAGVWSSWVTQWKLRAQEVSWGWLWHVADLLYRADRDVKRGLVDLPRALDLLIAAVGSRSASVETVEG